MMRCAFLVFLALILNSLVGTVLSKWLLEQTVKKLTEKERA